MTESSSRLTAARRDRAVLALTLPCAAHATRAQNVAVVVNTGNAVEELSTDKLRRLVSGIGTPLGDALTTPMTQTIAGAYAAWFSGRAEAIVEGHDVANRSAAVTTRSPNWFACAGVRVGTRVVPYAMHEDIRMADGDPDFASDRFRRETLGIRYEYAASAVVKTELRSLDRRSADRATELGIQLGLAF